jgi:hypothetical protein
VYKGTIAAYSITKKTAPKGKKVLSRKRKAEGVTMEEDKRAGYVSDEGGDGGVNNQGGRNALPSQAFAYLA